MHLSIRHKLSALAFGLTVVVAVGLTAFFSQRELRGMRRNLAAKGTTYAVLLSRETEPAIAFDDQVSAKEILEATAQDSDVRSIALYASDGHIVGSVGDPLVPPDHDVTDVEVDTSHGGVACVAPVISREGATGLLVLEMSTDQIVIARQHALRTSILAAVGALLFGILGAWAAGTFLSRRLRKVQRATQLVAGGDLSAPPVLDSSSDEIGLLARDFNAMTAALRNQVETIETNARTEQERLDALVTERTKELSARNRDMRLILDNANQGFLTMDRHGEISRERSDILTRWFGEIPDGATLPEVLSARAPAVAASLLVALDALFEDMLPRELLIEQLPAVVRWGDYHFSMEYRFLENGDASSVLVMISDATSEVARKRAEAAQRDLAALCSRIVSDERAVTEFLDEAAALRERIAAGSASPSTDTVLLRCIHTLKGNSALLGLSQLAEACHALETTIASEGNCTQDYATVTALCMELENRATVLMGAKSAGISLSAEEITALADAIASGMSRQDVARYVQRLRLEPVQRRLQRFGEQARALAERMEKDVTICVEGNDVRLDASRWAPFWASFVHVIRNAVDHGVETPELRAEAGKPVSATLTIRATETATHHVIEVEDDGRGIDFDALVARAKEKGFPEMSGEEALFADGLSTKEEATELSGRGVGLGAVRAAIEELGGRVLVQTRRGKGTKFTFAVPMRGALQGSLPPVSLRNLRMRSYGAS